LNGVVDVLSRILGFRFGSHFREVQQEVHHVRQLCGSHFHSSNRQRTKEAASELAAFGSMNAGRAFDRDISRGSTGDPLIDEN
jgi:hypothetical protein